MALSKIFDKDNFIKLYKEIRYDNKKIKHSDIVDEVLSQHTSLHDTDSYLMFSRSTNEASIPISS